MLHLWWQTKAKLAIVFIDFFIFFFLFLSISSVFHPLRGNSRGWNFVCNFNFLQQQKGFFSAFWLRKPGPTLVPEVFGLYICCTVMESFQRPNLNSLHISSSLCQNIVGTKISASGVSPKWVKSRRRKRNTLWTRGDRTLAAKRQKVGNNNGQLCIANATLGGACKSPGPNEEEEEERESSQYLSPVASLKVCISGVAQAAEHL